MLRGLVVLHDYYFNGGSLPDVALATAEGLLATGGLLVAPRSALASARRATACAVAVQGLTGHAIAGGWSDPNTDVIPVPYVGLGYADLPNRMGWGFRACFGLMALSPHSAVSGQRSSLAARCPAPRAFTICCATCGSRHSVGLMCRTPSEGGANLRARTTGQLSRVISVL